MKHDHVSMRLTDSLLGKVDAIFGVGVGFSHHFTIRYRNRYGKHKVGPLHDCG